MNESQLIQACWERRLIEPPAGFEPERRSTTAKQSAAVAKLIHEFGKCYCDIEYAGDCFLGTVDAVEYRITRAGKVHVNYVHPARRRPDRVAGLLTA